MAMANMKDSDRLDLIKELGGSRVYEQKRKESFSGMEISRAKRQQIQDTVSQTLCCGGSFLYLQ